MPFLFRTEIKESAIHGRGVFALEDIPQGATYWVFECPKEREVPAKGCDTAPNRTYAKEQLAKVGDPKLLAAIFHGGFYYEDADLFIELRDGTHFMNHSEDCNSQIVYNPEGDHRRLRSVAWKAIAAGEEITEFYGNYLSRKGDWVAELMERHFPERKQFEDSIAPTKPFAVRNR